MDKYFFLERTGANEVKGLKVTVVKSNIANMILTIFTQDHHQIKRDLPLKIIAEGSVEDVFSHLPKSVIDEEGIINVVENNYGVKTELTIKPLSIKQGKYEFVFGGLEYWSADNFDVINCEKFLRYQKRLPKKAPAPKPKTQRKSRKAPYFVSAQVQELA